MDKSKLKDNSKKHPGERDKWNARKRIRPKQMWVWDVEPVFGNGRCLAATTEGVGHWEKVTHE